MWWQKENMLPNHSEIAFWTKTHADLDFERLLFFEKCDFIIKSTWHVPFFFVPLLHCAVCQGNLGYIIGLSFSSLSGLSTKKLQTQYCPVRFTWHRGSIMLPCQQKTNKPKKVIYIPSPIKTQMNFVRFCFWAELKISAIFLNYPFL